MYFNLYTTHVPFELFPNPSVPKSVRYPTENNPSGAIQTWNSDDLPLLKNPRSITAQ